jgi:N-acetylglutamate synthase-like GNAT family acetyltransferase
MAAMQIREATTQDLGLLAMLVSESNKDVALKFGLNSDNCPKHPSFCTEAWVKADLARGERYFLLQYEETAVGCVAYERPNEEVAYLNRLSVLPAHRTKGTGTRLVHFILELARSSAAKTVSIGVIGEHTDLQRWYEKLGFTSGELKRFGLAPEKRTP